MAALVAARDQRYRRRPELRVHTLDQALDFVNDVGFCFVFGDQNVEIPTLFEAIAGRPRAFIPDHYDAEISRTWDYKDHLPIERQVYYGKQLRGKPTIISLDLLPAFYALTDNYGQLDDYLEEFAAGTLSRDARAIYEALLEHGAQATTHLRRYAGLAGSGDIARRFERAVAELQLGFKIVKSGIANTGRWGYAYVYDLFLHRYPQVPEQARALSRDAAMERILTQHLSNVIAQPEAALRRLLRWDTWSWERLCASSRARNMLAEVQVENESSSSWCLQSVAERLHESGQLVSS